MLGRMRPERKEICIAITERLMKYPCAAPFIDLVDKELYPKYYEIITTPQCLSSILSKLKDDEYGSILAWEHDIGLIWYNAEKFNGSTSYLNYLAQALAKHYKKMKKVLDTMVITDWTTSLFEASENLLKSTSTPPPSLRQHFPSELFADTVNREFTESEFRGLLKALELPLNRPSDRLFMYNVLHECEPNIEVTDYMAPIDLRKLSIVSLIELQKFARDRFREENLEYPEE